MTNNTDPPVEDYLDKVSKQKAAYKELDKFEPGQSSLQYFPVPVGEWKAWKKEKDRKDMEEYDKKQKSKLDVLAMREELTRSNGHDKPQVKLNEGNPTMTTCNFCNNPVGKCNCKENPKFDHLAMKVPIDHDGNTISVVTQKVNNARRALPSKDFAITNPNHCDLKKSTTKKKRVSKKK